MIRPRLRPGPRRIAPKLSPKFPPKIPPVRALRGRGVVVGLVLGLGLVVASMHLTACSGRGEDGTPGPVIVRVVDGDTVVVRSDNGDETVRLIGVDTPETKHPSKPVQCFGQEATAFTKSLLPAGTAVRLERDVEERDRFDRVLAYVYRADDDVFVNLELARQGFADVLTIPPNVAYTGEFVAAVAEARTDQRGLWSACDSFGSSED